MKRLITQDDPKKEPTKSNIQLLFEEKENETKRFSEEDNSSGF